MAALASTRKEPSTEAMPSESWRTTALVLGRWEAVGNQATSPALETLMPEGPDLRVKFRDCAGTSISNPVA